MYQNRLFNRTRLQLAAWYALVFGLLLGLCGIGLERAVLYAQQYILRQKLQSLAGTLHDSIEPILEQPDQINPKVKTLLPGLCIKEEVCQQQINSPSRHIVGVFQQVGYYLRFTKRTGELLATVGQQPKLVNQLAPTQFWQILKDRNGDRFYQISLPLRTQTGDAWGYLQIGRSLKEWDDYLVMLRLFLLLGLPFVMMAIGGASWWLSGLAMQPIYQSYRRIQQFTSDAAHELRTPLTILQSAIEETKLAENLLEVHQNLEMMERQNVRLSSLVKDLLLICRIEQHEISNQFQPCCLNDLIVDLVEELESLAVAAEITLKTQLPINKSVVILGDSFQLYRMVTNLIVNGIRYTPAGGMVTVSLEETHYDAYIRVRDTGIGIASEDRSRIFNRFYRVQSDRSRSTGGSGLGLSIAQAIAHVHQGSIQVQSELGQGSTFTIQLPLKSKSHSKLLNFKG
ncbi:two-component sensor histidine kinase [Aphanothece hegewaldii CCALA 016]|uniref:histidine kinase n=1 Tax=Aphanothece hegewaldii CCALA 016 TaxID=2107694 RepID=A0A2T1LRE2_9CHRO|nr:two-component system sensor histidine kinase RppB [Aphanothece hegewaldii]PSF31265.1 two-component sensor histidine kinase [Aphanothece hegewaldii CCALA 016]